MKALILLLSALPACLPFGISSALTIPANGQAASSQTKNATDESCPYFGSTPETSGKLVTPAAVVRRVHPKYPSDARRSHIEGLVVLCVTIGSDGVVRNVRALSGAKELIPAAIEALEQWRFRPFQANGQPVEAAIQVKVIGLNP